MMLTTRERRGGDVPGLAFLLHFHDTHESGYSRHRVLYSFCGCWNVAGISKVRDLVIQGLRERAVMQRSTGSGLGGLRMPTLGNRCGEILFPPLDCFLCLFHLTLLLCCIAFASAFINVCRRSCGRFTPSSLCISYWLSKIANPRIAPVL